MPSVRTSPEVFPLSRLLNRRETRVRGLTTHCRRDPRNAKRVGQSVQDLFCTGAQEVGKAWLVRRLRKHTPVGGERPSECATPQRPSHKTTHTGTQEETSDHAPHHILSSAQYHTRAAARWVSSVALKHARNGHAQCDTKPNTARCTAVSSQKRVQGHVAPPPPSFLSSGSLSALRGHARVTKVLFLCVCGFVWCLRFPAGALGAGSSGRGPV